MELANSPMTAKQAAYRATYRERIDGWYNGYLHVAMIYTIGALSMAYYIAHMADIRWTEWLVVPVTFLFCNLFEWWLHTNVMHRPMRFPGARAIYQRHTLQHHQFFTEKEMRFAGPHDWRVTFFPPYALIVFILMFIPGVIVFGWLGAPNLGWLLITTTLGSAGVVRGGRRSGPRSTRRLTAPQSRPRPCGRCFPSTGR